MENLSSSLREESGNSIELQGRLYEEYYNRLKASSALEVEYKKIIKEIKQFEPDIEFAMQILKIAYEIIVADKYIKFKQHRDRDKSKNLEVLESYNKILDEMVYLAKKLGLKNSFEYSILFSVLYSQGFLSYDGSFYYDKTEDYPTNKSAFSICSGVGVCRHISDFLTDFLNKFDDITASICTCNLPHEEEVEEVDYRLCHKVEKRRKTTVEMKLLNSRRKTAKDLLDYIFFPIILVIGMISKKGTLSFIPKFFSKKLNHAVVLISDKTTSKEVLYGYDPTNSFPITTINQDITTTELTYSAFPKNPSKFDIPQSLLYFANSEKSIELLREFYSRRKYIPSFEITSEHIEYIDNIIREKIDLIAQFHWKILPYIEQIHEYNLGKTKQSVKKSK